MSNDQPSIDTQRGTTVDPSSYASCGDGPPDEKLAWTIFEASPDAMVMTGADGTIELLNERTETLFGYERHELLGASVEVLIPERFRDAHRAHRDGYGAAPEVREMGSGLELRALRRDGSEFPVEISLSPMRTEGELRVLAAIRDVSRRVAVEQRDRDVRRALDIVEDGVFMFDAETLRFHYVNAGATAQVGYSREELLAMTPLDIQPEFSRESFQSMLEPLLAGEMTSLRFTTMHRHRDGTDVPVEIVLQSPPTIREDERRGCVALCRELGERLRQQAELARLHLRSAVFEDRERMARAMHDTVIGRLFGTGLALEAAAVRTNDAEVGSRLRDAVRQIDMTIGEIRAAVFDDEGGLLAGRDVSEEILALVREQEQGLGFEPRVELEGLINELDDPTTAHLLSTLREALTNVAKHANATSTRVCLSVDEDTLRLSVVDDGDGIPPADGSAEPAASKHGLRNILARATVLGGRATITSEPGNGTAIEWVVPLDLDSPG